MLLRSLILGLVSTLLVAACGGSGGGSDTTIAFISDRDGNAELYTMNADGGDVTRLTETEEREDTPIWSPDGEKIAFWRLAEDGGAQYIVMDADGSNEVVIAETDTPLAPLGDHSWSPNSTQLVLQLSVDGAPTVFVASADGSSLEELDTDGQVAFPFWSPTDDRILLQTGLASLRLVTVLPDGSDPVELTDDGREPAWSPDGSMVAFVSNRDGSQQVYVTAADGGTPVQVSDGGVSAGGTGIAWSPDSTRVAFYSLHEETTDLSVANPDGSELTALTTNPATDVLITEIVWSADNQLIAFNTVPVDLSASGDVFIIGADGSDITNVTRSPLQSKTIFGWTHDSQQLIFSSEPRPGETEFEGAINIYKIDADGSNEEALTAIEAREDQGTIRPDR